MGSYLSRLESAILDALKVKSSWALPTLCVLIESSWSVYTMTAHYVSADLSPQPFTDTLAALDLTGCQHRNLLEFLKVC